VKTFWIEIAFAVTFCQTFGWIYFDGRKRRSKSYRHKVMDDLERMPGRQRDMLTALFYPQHARARLFQAMVVGMCSLILAVPIYLPFAWYLSGSFWASFGAIFLASFIAANLGEFTLNW
jgi:hypothetical protein